MAAQGSACEVWFYHLERSSPAEALRPLLEKALARGWRALVRSPEEARLRQLNSALWLGREDAFLAHGLASEPHAERQPVLLTTAEANLNGATMLVLLDDAEPVDLAGFERCVLVFDGGDDGAVAAARQRWRLFKDAGHPTSYWKQTAKGWEKAG